MGEDKKAAVLGEEKSEPYTYRRLSENIERRGVYEGEVEDTEISLQETEVPDVTVLQEFL